ncbi:hypothetical protein [Streptacidiphilus sp. EB103A]|uniref:hypothetical protein n=1 Tax=Streptacidiphilus sp. EB103A TaxID=3156275 RepID=UPI003514592E
MTALEEKLARYTAPSSATEQDKQERAERMVRSALDGWSGLSGIQVRYLLKGSYKNNTNVRADSDVDIAVIHQGFYYYNDSALYAADKIKSSGVSGFHYSGLDWRSELERALRIKFGTDCDTSGNTAIEIHENGGRVSADVVPSFEHRHYYYDIMGKVTFRSGTTTPRKGGADWAINYPEQQYENGVAKNDRTGRRYKQLVRILKRVENDLVATGAISPLPSYFMECLVYRVPDGKFGHAGDTPLTSDLSAAIKYIWNATAPGADAINWHEPNGIKPLFGDGQKWALEDAHNLALKAWQHLELK